MVRFHEDAYWPKLMSLFTALLRPVRWTNGSFTGCFANFSKKTWSAKKMHHDEANKKSFKTVISDFLFLKFCHRDFSPQSNVKNHNFMNRKSYQLFDEIMIFNITL